MRRKRYAASLEAVLQDCPTGYRLRYEWVPVRHLDLYEEARLLERVKRDRLREKVFLGCVHAGIIVGGFTGAWVGYRLFGPNGATGGCIVGMVLGGALGLVLPLLLICAALMGLVYVLGHLLY